MHRSCRGAEREDFPMYLAGREFRYNRRDEHLPSILFDGLCRSRLIKGLPH
jgi:hypothetical protein